MRPKIHVTDNIYKQIASMNIASSSGPTVLDCTSETPAEPYDLNLTREILVCGQNIGRRTR